MATKVKFLVNEKYTTFEVFAFFPQLKHNKRMYGNDLCMSYAHNGQHSPASKEYAKESRQATESEYLPLKKELESIGYKLKVCKS